MALTNNEIKDLTVLILGGTNTVARALVRYLLDDNDQAGGVSFVRLADRFSVSPPSTYLDKPFLELLNDDNPRSKSKFEYKQTNLGVKDRHLELFTPPAGTGKERFDVVFDLTGETSAEKPELIQIQNTYTLALSLASSAVELPTTTRPRAYIRLTFPYYEMKSSTPQSENADLRPDGVRGRWWHETLRGLGKLQDKGLNLGVIRCGAPYGRGGWDGEVVARLVVGHVYSYLKEEMKFLHNSGLRIHTVHTLDIASSLLLLARYLLSKPPSPKLTPSDSGSPLSFPFTSPTTLLGLGKRASLSEKWKTVPTVVPESEVIKVLMFNIVDEGDSTQEKLAKAVADVWGIKWGFLNSTVASLVQQFAKTDFSEMVEDVNEKHVEAWSEMLAASKPPITSTPITPFLDEHAFKKHAICLDGSKAKRILGFKAQVPRIEVSELKRIVDDFQKDGIWPAL